MDNKKYGNNGSNSWKQSYDKNDGSGRNYSQSFSSGNKEKSSSGNSYGQSSNSRRPKYVQNKQSMDAAYCRQLVMDRNNRIAETYKSEGSKSTSSTYTPTGTPRAITKKFQ